MPRPCCLRHVDARPCAVYFKPAGIPARMLEEVVLTLDEFEALRLADMEGMYQEQAAGKMNVSRPTFSRIVEQARRKVATALIQGKALRLEGGAVVFRDSATPNGGSHPCARAHAHSQHAVAGAAAKEKGKT